VDEPGDASHALLPDKDNPDHDNARKHALWGMLMAGGAGVEWYFGYEYDQSDLTCQNWRSRANMWEQCRYALNFFKDQNIPFWKMKNRNDLIGNKEDTNEKYCLAQEGDLYLVYLGHASTSYLDLSGQEGSYSVKWFNPREGGDLQEGSVASVQGGNKVKLENPPADNDKDWLVVVKK